MEENKKKRYMTQAINDEILSKLSLKNRYQFLNTNLMTVLDPPEFNFLKKVQIYIQHLRFLDYPCFRFHDPLK